MGADKKKVRQKFRDDVFKRDGYKCKTCDAKHIENTEHFLDAHHITDRNEMPNGGYVKENGITLCKDKCHMKAELYHISGGTKFEPGFHPNDLYKMIGSSKEKAVAASLRL